MKLCNFCAQLTFDLILRLGGIFRLGIHPSAFSYISRNTFIMDAEMYSKMPTEFFFGSSDWQLLNLSEYLTVKKRSYFKNVDKLHKCIVYIIPV